MGAFLLSAVQKGKRFATPNAEILIHQPLIAGNGISGQTTEIKQKSPEIPGSIIAHIAIIPEKNIIKREWLVAIGFNPTKI